MRHDDRAPNQLRPIRIHRRFTQAAPGSVLVQAGRTTVLCTASVQAEVPRWSTHPDRGWVTAEYSMLPGSTCPRKQRDRAHLDGRTTEIQRLIGRSLRAVTDMASLGPRTVTIDCDVLEADGGTRTLSITGALVAMIDAMQAIRHELPDPARFPLVDSVAAVSVGMVAGNTALDLDYREDFGAEVDMNIVMTGKGRLVEVQGTGEKATFTEQDLQTMLNLARSGIQQLTDLQRTALGPDWPF
jgi:ribonuclease PH